MTASKVISKHAELQNLDLMLLDSGEWSIFGEVAGVKSGGQESRLTFAIHQNIKRHCKPRLRMTSTLARLSSIKSLCASSSFPFQLPARSWLHKPEIPH